MLWYTVKTRDHTRVKILIECGADSGVADSEGVTPLHVALMQGEFVDEIIARILLRSRSTMSISEILQGGQSVDQFVSRPRQDNQRFEVPPEVRSDVNAHNSGCEMLLMQAVHFGQENVDLCAKNGGRIDVDCPDRCGNSAFWLSVDLMRDDISERFFNDSR
ncbi:ankyrin [Penicillium sp. IBT 35674x]|nr:ankyrin [Penicillium sp. IBT 35674x]